MKQPTREDYELAAKAAGMKLIFLGKTAYSISEQENLPLPHISPSWQPLDDDGDSRRLQVAIGADLQIRKTACAAVTSTSRMQIADYKDHNNDKCEAARNAVFFLAVEIGRAMP